MKIVDALRIEKGSAVAIVGAGGKTSLMLALAEALPKTVCLTTTTKLAYSEGLGSITHIPFTTFENQIGNRSNEAGIVLVTNSLDEKMQKWQGLTLSQADLLISTCKQSNATCLVEADGARRLSLKAPAAWEPVIPPLVDLVIVVVGLSVIGKPLNGETVFRPELFSVLTGLKPDEPVQLDHIIKMLNHPDGGLKGIPPNSKTAVVFNQADAYSFIQDDLVMIKEALQGNFCAAISTSLQAERQKCLVIYK